MTLLLIVLSSLAGGVLSVLLAATILTVNTALLERLLPRLISFSTGTMLGAALIGMLPHAARTLPMPTITTALLGGFILFFLLEKLLIWRHCHKQECDVHASSGPLLLVGDAFHNFVDGLVLAGAFLESTQLGLAVALSTIAHEVPQELGEFVVYLHGGYSRRRALLLNMATSMTCVAGALVGYFFLSEAQTAGPYLLAFAASGFIYVALADLIPAQRAPTGLRLTLVDLLLLVAGIGLIAAFTHQHAAGG
jgi:zinc and cadmium transporter